MPFPLPQQLQIHRSDLLEQFLRQAKRAQTGLDFFLQLPGDGELAHPPIPHTDGENPDRPMALPLAFLAMLTAGLIATHHST